jgi:hypothetical protein
MRYSIPPGNQRYVYNYHLYLESTIDPLIGARDRWVPPPGSLRLSLEEHGAQMLSEAECPLTGLFTVTTALWVFFKTPLFPQSVSLQLTFRLHQCNSPHRKMEISVFPSRARKLTSCFAAHIPCAVVLASTVAIRIHLGTPVHTLCLLSSPNLVPKASLKTQSYSVPW